MLISKRFLVFSRQYLVRSRLCYNSVASVCSLSSSVCNLCIVAKRCVLQQKLLLTAYRKLYGKPIGTKMNDIDLCLEVVQGQCGHSSRVRFFTFFFEIQKYATFYGF